MAFWGTLSINFLLISRFHAFIFECITIYSPSWINLFFFFEKSGIEVKPGKPYVFQSDDEGGRLHLSQVCRARVEFNVVYSYSFACSI